MRGDWALFWLLNTDGGTKHRRTLLQTLQQRPYPCINEPQTSKYCVFWRINEKKQIRTIFCDVYFQHKWEKWKMVRHILVALQLAARWLSLERWWALSLCVLCVLQCLKMVWILSWTGSALKTILWRQTGPDRTESDHKNWFGITYITDAFLTFLGSLSTQLTSVLGVCSG